MKTSAPAIRSYLDELDRLLRDVPADVREETLTGIREHLDAAVGDSADPTVAQAALARLGPPASIADAARSTAERPAHTRPTQLVAASVSALAMLGAALATLGIGALSSLSAGFDDDSDWSISPALVFLTVAASLLLWAFASVLGWASRAWSRRDTFILTGVWPAALVVQVGADLLTSAQFMANLLTCLAQLFAALLAVAVVGRLWLRREPAAGRHRAQSVVS